MKDLQVLKFITWQRNTYEQQLQNCRETWIGNEEQLNSCIQQVHVDLDIEN